MASRGVVLGGMIWLLACAPAARADVTVNWPVDTVAVDGHCTLREAFAAANAPGAPSADCPGASPGGTTTIRVADNLTLAHASGQLEVLGGAQVALAGPGAGSVAITADGAGARLLTVDAGGQLTISGVTVSGFTAPAGSDGSAAGGPGQSAPAAGSGASGGAIVNHGTLTIDAVTFQGDRAGAGGNGATGGAGATGSFGGTGGAGGAGGSGGAIDNEGTLTVTHSTFTGDAAGKGGSGGTGGAGGAGAAGASGGAGGGGGSDGGGGAGGAIYNGGTLVVSDTTFSGVAAGAAGNAGPGGAGGQGGDIASGTAGSGGEGGASGSQGADGGAGGAIATGFGGSVTLTRVVMSGTSGAGGSPGNPGIGGKAGLATTGTNGSTGPGGTAAAGGSAGRGGGISSFAPLTIHESVITGHVGAAGTGAHGGLPGGQRGSCCQTFGALTPGAAGGQGAGGGAIAQSLASATIVSSQLQGSAGDGGYGGFGADGDSNRNGSAGGAGGDGGSGGALDVTVPGGASVQLVNDTIVGYARGAGGQGGSGGVGKVNGAAGATGAAGVVGGVQRSGTSPVTLRNSIVEGFNSAAGNSCAAGVTDGGHDLVWPDATCPGGHADPLLVPAFLPDGRQLQGLDPASPAIDQVPASGAGCPAVDIRGHARPVGPACDIGAWEHTPAPVCSDQDVTVPYETATTVVLACTVGDAGDPGSVTTTQDPAHGAFNGQQVYTPAAGYVGPDTVRYRLSNGDGSSATATIHLTVAPPAAPTITGTTPASPAQAGSPHVTGTAPAGSTVGLFTTADCSGTPAVTGSAATFASPGLVVPTSGDGTTTITARYVDSEAVTSACSTATTFTVDSAAPDTLIDGGPAGTTTDAQPTFTFHASEAGASFACSVDTGTPSFAPCSGPGGAHRPPAPLAPGTYTFRVRATDAAGNTDATPATRTFSIAAPGSGSTGGGTGGTTGGSGGTGAKRPDTIITRHPKARLTVRTAKAKAAVGFGFRATQAGATFTCRLDRQKARTCRSPKRYRVGRGRHVFTVTARTKAGVDPTPARFRFTIKVRRV